MENEAGTSRAAEPNSHTYYVFINHRGPDTKNTFASHLYAALQRAGFRPFLDAEDIELCQGLKGVIGEALKGSRVHVAIFSKRYAESRNCLNELCSMLDSGKRILPVFYHVDPVHLRRIENGPFEEGFKKHIAQETEEQISKWKGALREISAYRGLRLDEVKWNEEELVRRVVAAVRESKPNVLPDSVNRGDQRDRRLNVLVLGKSKLVEEVVNRVCGAGRHTQFQDHIENCGLTESRNSSPPIYLYGDTDGKNGNDLTDVKAFVKARNERWHDWHRTKVEARNQVYRRSSKELPDRTLRLHMVWVVCRKISELPEGVKWSEITEKLYGLPVQILVNGTEGTPNQVLDSEYDKILAHGKTFFPNAQSVEELIVKIAASTNGDLKENLWRKCWAAKTRAEIENVAKLIRGIRKELGAMGISVNLGVPGGARIPKKVSLSRSAEFYLKFLCSYWDVPQDKMHGLLQSPTFSELAASGNTINIRPGGFVKFCLIVASIILYDTCKNPEHMHNWDDASDAGSELLQAEAEKCYGPPYFPSTLGLSYYDQMSSDEIREFLQDTFERNRVGICLRHMTPCPVVSGHSISSKFMKLICRGKTGIMA